jgi:hypothetical protein
MAEMNLGHCTRRRNPVAVVSAVLVVVSWIWLVVVEVFMALIVDPATAPQ